MIYIADIDTPANTAASSPLKTVLKITKGLVYKLELSFPPGPYGLLHCYINDGGHRVWPSHSPSGFRGDNVNMRFDELHLKLQPPYSFDIFTYNEDDTYDHNLIVKIGLVSKDMFVARFLPAYGYADFIERLKTLNDEQDQRRKEERKEVLSKPIKLFSPEG